VVLSSSPLPANLPLKVLGSLYTHNYENNDSISAQSRFVSLPLRADWHRQNMAFSDVCGMARSNTYYVETASERPAS
jgi:hypothetical protein